MFDPLVLTSLDQLLFKLKILFTFFYKTTSLNEEVNCTEPFPTAIFPWPCSQLFDQAGMVCHEPSSLFNPRYEQLRKMGKNIDTRLFSELGMVPETRVA